MTNFLIESTISLMVFLIFYHLFLEREKMHQFNRFYLLFSIVISLIIPFLSFEIIKIILVTQTFEPLSNVVASTIIPENEIREISIPPVEKINYTPYILWSLYGIISIFLSLRFGKNILKLISKTKSNPNVKYKNANLVLVKEKTLPHTFLNSIFINFEDYNNSNIEDELYAHELVHVTQKHTLDILFIEFLTVIFWFNPLIILYKKAIQLNHEFLADDKVVKKHNNVSFYQNLLLKKGNENKTIYLASNLNYSITKKRLIMMTKNTSQKIAIFKKIAIFPILAGLIYFFCIEVVAQEKVIYSTFFEKNNHSHFIEDTIKNANISLKKNTDNAPKNETINSIKNEKLKALSSKKIIVIDAGHGGHDYGATVDDLSEKKLILDIIEKIKKNYLESDIEIHYTRTSDEFINLKDRTNFINAINPNLVISLHINSNKNVDKNGFEIFVSDKNELFEKSKMYAENLSIDLSKTQLKNGGLKTAPLWILNKSNAPTIVVELGFISNEKDRKFLSSENGQTEIAKIILKYISNI